MFKTIEWKEFKLCDIFRKIERGTRLVQLDREKGSIPLATAGYQNEGISDFISNPEQKIYKNKITVDMFCNAFYRDYEFCCDDNILILINDDLNENVCLFLTTIISKDKFKFAYGRQYRKKDFLKHVIKLPVDDKGDPDWKFMNDYIEELQERERANGSNIKDSLITNVKAKKNKINLNITSWKNYYLKDLFDIVLSKGDLKEPDCEIGSIPLISSGDTNNGIVKYIDENGDGKAQIFKGNCLTLDMFCKCYYQPHDFYAVSHGRVNILIPKIKFDKYIGAFISTIINHERFRFSYGRAVYSNVAANLLVKLPTNENGLDYEFMTNFIKNLPYSDRI